MQWDLLVVEDDIAMAELLATLADECGFAARICHDVDSAMAAMSRQTPDALFTDLRLPDGDGVTVIRRAKALTRELPAVLITGFANVPDVVAAFRAGALDLLTKPFETDQITQVLERIQEILQQRRRFDAALKRLELLDASGPALVAESPAMQELVTLCERVAGMDVPILLQGETGTGKNLIARLIHDLSNRRDGPWFSVNCGAVSATLAESELFGHEKGAFTGADRRKRGLLELADGGTLFLDEINSAIPEIQTRLLQFVQEQTLVRVGGQSPIHVNVRIVAATNQSLAAAVENGSFRQDLFYRLNVFPLTIPPLRERREDIVPLAQTFLARSAQRFGTTATQFSKDARHLLEQYDWPGNVRELENLVFRLAILCNGDTIGEELLPPEIRPAAVSTDDTTDLPPDLTLAALERLWIERTLRRCQGNKTEAARRLGINPSTLHRKLRD